jgi:hypothetical protein
METNLKAVTPVVSFPFNLSDLASRTNFKKFRALRLHTSVNDEYNACEGSKRPLELKEYSNKFLKGISPR